MSIYQRGSQWWVKLQHKGRVYRMPAGPAKRDAERDQGVYLDQIAKGTFGTATICETTFAEFVPEYLRWAKAHKRSWKRDAQSLGFLGRALGRLLLDRVDLGRVEDYKRARLSGTITAKRRVRDKVDRTVFREVPVPATGPTINRELRCLTKLLALAVDLGKLAASPLGRGRLKLFPEGEGRIKYLEPEQIRTLFASCSDRARPIVTLLVSTGMRRNEVLGLRWEECDTRRGVIRLPGSRTKNGRPRTVPCNGAALGVLREAEARCKELSQKAEAEGRELEGEGLVFLGDQGEPVRSIRTAWEIARVKAGLSDLWLHDLRHVAASAAASRGVPLAVIGELLGHRTPSMTARYAHLLPGAVKGGVEQIGAFLEGKGPATGTRTLALVETSKASEAEPDQAPAPALATVR